MSWITFIYGGSTAILYVSYVYEYCAFSFAKGKEVERVEEKCYPEASGLSPAHWPRTRRGPMQYLCTRTRTGSSRFKAQTFCSSLCHDHERRNCSDAQAPSPHEATLGLVRLRGFWGWELFQLWASPRVSLNLTLWIIILRVVFIKIIFLYLFTLQHLFYISCIL